MLIDSHCHINCLKGAEEKGAVKQYLDAATAAGVSHFLCVSIDWETYPEVLAIAEAYTSVFASVGVHPNHQTGYEPSVEDLIKKADNKNVVAIGETGLDYFRNSGDTAWQRARFRRHIEAAKQCNKPLIIHTREAREDTINILREEKAAQAGGVMHCFTESWEMAEAAMDMGFYISFSGIVTFKTATELQAVARQVPLERMLLETDSPYLAPVPYRGKQNQPAYVKNIADFIADLRGVSVAEIKEHTSRNFFQLFHSATEN
ncbi:MAG TPA: TatD family deoxyribonuclease [Gammaproteobacteria bacterium]|nr:TatD family deoxyribonuclease [Gammaproteobacteria bacterium]